MGRGFDGKKEAVCQIPSLLLHLWRALPIPSSALFRMEPQWDTGREKEGWEGEHLWRRVVHGRRRRRRARLSRSLSAANVTRPTPAAAAAPHLLLAVALRGEGGRRRKAISSSSFLEAFALVLVLLLLLLLLPLSHTQHMFFVCLLLLLLLLLLLSFVVLCPPPPPPPATPLHEERRKACFPDGGSRRSNLESLPSCSYPVPLRSNCGKLPFVVLECCLCCLHEPQGPSTLRSTYRPDGGRDTKL